MFGALFGSFNCEKQALQLAFNCVITAPLFCDFDTGASGAIPRTAAESLSRSEKQRHKVIVVGCESVDINQCNLMLRSSNAFDL